MSRYSIILPVRNGEEYVKECVHSILSQTSTDFNLIVLDNASTDGTLEWIQSVKDDRIVIYPSKESLTMEVNWARIKEIDKNEFITIIGHDDILHPDYLEEMTRLIQKHPGASLYQTHYKFIDGTSKFMNYCRPMDEMQYGYEFLACHLARSMDSMGTGYMMRSADYDRLGGMPDYPNLLFADYELWIKLSLISYKATSANASFSYRIHNSVSKLANGENYQLAFERYVYFMAALSKQDKNVEAVVEKYGHDMLMYYCESLSHRLLKTPVALRKTKVTEFINKCKALAELLIPGQPFEPLAKFRIRIAGKLDHNKISRSLFYVARKIVG